MQLTNNGTLVLYITVIFGSYLLTYAKKEEKIKIKANKIQIIYINTACLYLFLSLLPMIFVLSCRYYTGADYEQYTWNYWTVINGNNFVQSSIFKQEPLYTLSIYLSNFILPGSVQFWFALVAVLMFINIINGIYLFELDNVCIFVLLFGLYNYLHCFNYVRQMFAASIIILAIGNLLKKNRQLTFLGLIIIATLIHRSSIVFMLLWFVCKLDRKKNNLYRLLILCSPLYLNILARIMRYLPFFKRYALYFGGNMQMGIGFLVELIPLIFILVISIFSNMNEYDPIENALINIGLLAIPLRLMSYFSYAAGRLFITCSFFAILAYCLKRKKVYINIFIIIIFFIYFVLEFYLFNNSEVFPYTFCF